MRTKLWQQVYLRASVLLAMALGAGPSFRAPAQTFPIGNWPVSTPAAEGMDPDKFAYAMSNMPPTAMVIRHGKIIATLGDITRRGPLYSASKSLLAALAGTLMQRGLITLDTLVPGSDSPVPPLAPVRTFLNMTSDYNLTPHDPGQHYAYNNSAAIHYGNWMFSTFFPGMTPMDGLRAAYLNTLGIQDGLDLTGEVSGWGGGGFIISTRDYARLGYLILHGGNWNGQQLLPPDFVSKIYYNQVPLNISEGGLGSGQVDNQTNVSPRLPGTYSYGFWTPNTGVGFDGSNTSAVVASASGSYGTSMHIIPQYDMILVGVNTVDTITGGRIPGYVVDLFGAAIVDSSTGGTNPGISFTSPAFGATVSGTVNLSVNVSSNFTTVKFYVGGVPVGTATSAPFTVAWNSNTVNDGSYQVAAVASDSLGNTAQTSISITVSNSGTSSGGGGGTGGGGGGTGSFTVAVTSPMAGATVSGTLPLSASVTDSFPITSVSFYVDGVNRGTATTAPYSITWNSNSVNNGPYQVVAVATDSTGNTAQGLVNITVSNGAGTSTGGGSGGGTSSGPLAVVVTAPANGTTVKGSITLSANVTGGSGVPSVSFYVDGVLRGTAAAPPYSITWNSNSVMNGPYTVVAVAKDAAGAVVQAQSSITVGN